MSRFDPGDTINSSKSPRVAQKYKMARFLIEISPDSLVLKKIRKFDSRIFQNKYGDKLILEMRLELKQIH